jgi:hypothetical protein
MRLKLQHRETNRSSVVTIDDNLSLYELQLTLIQQLTSLTPEQQVLTVRNLGRVTEGAAETSITVSSIISSGSIIIIEKSSNSSTSSSSFSTKTWSCEVCTLINSDINSNCTACTSTRPTRSSGSSTTTDTATLLDSNSKSITPTTVTPTTPLVVSGTGSLAGFQAKRRAIPSDNSCLFNSIAYNCDGKRGHSRIPSWKPNSPARRLRQIVAEQVISYPNKYNKAILDGKTPGEYKRWILDEKRWGGGIELAILSEYYQCKICSIDVNTCLPYISGDEKYTKTCFLLYNGVHYDAIAFATSDNCKLVQAEAIQSEEVDVTTVPMEDYENALLMVIELSKQLQGTCKDLKKNFKVQCLQCYEKFQGRTECVKHAQESQHNQFGEYRG